MIQSPRAGAKFMLRGLQRIGFKLAILAGVPMIGALLLALEIESGARDRARTAEAIGSVEDLAELSARMTDTVNELQTERALSSLRLGLGSAKAPDTQAEGAAKVRLVAQESQTDIAAHAVDAFLSKLDFERLPARLGGNLRRARHALEQRAAERAAVLAGTEPVMDLLDYYGQTNAALIGATAALADLSNDGELVRDLSSLVAIMQVQECESRKHAVLNHRFAMGEFTPGLFRVLVTLATEQAVHVATFQSYATAAQVTSYRRVMQKPAALASAVMLEKALGSEEDELDIDENSWFEAQRSSVQELATLERGYAETVRQIARHKLRETRRAVQYSEALAVGVVLVSSLLALLIGRGIGNTVGSLAKVARRVQKEQDFSLRAVKTSSDELGMLTDSFNEMLSGIQHRDQELSSHRENLERLVGERTTALSKRNEDLRLVLDTVDQGLVTLDKSGRMASERSRAFDTFFGAPTADVPYFTHLAGGDGELAFALELDWAQMVDGVLPLEVALDQAKSRLKLGERDYALGYKPLLDGATMTGALLTVSDVTGETSARRAEQSQREQLLTFMRIMKNQSGFRAFFEDAQRMVQRIRDENFESEAERFRTIHTLKGNAAVFDVNTVSEAAHALEQAIADGVDSKDKTALTNLVRAWEAFAESTLPVLQNASSTQSGVTQPELEAIVRAAREGRLGDLDELVRRTHSEPVRGQLERIADQLSSYARRLHKSAPEVVISTPEIRLPAQRFGPFWSAFAHIVQNVADHGLETTEERSLAGKAAHNRVTLTARLSDDAFVLEVSDDGRGIDWERVAESARTRRLPHATDADLVEALFATGLSTRPVVSGTSGRGVGMSAIREICRTLGGDCSIQSRAGEGTQLTMKVSLN